MKNRIKKIISFFIVLITILTNITQVFALSFENGQVITLEKDHDCISVLKFKDKDLLKGVTYVVYRDPETGREQPAFCVEPSKNGIGTGAGDSYDVTLSLLRDQKLWRVLYKGYMGSKYTNWQLECSDDLYYATKTAIHCLVEGVAPIDKYEVPNRVGWGENVSLEEVQRRGEKVLEVAQFLYNYGINGGDNYLTPELYINKRGEIEKQEINGEQYLIQKFYLTGNREIYTYRVEISNFPEGTKILNSADVETDTMKNVTFKIAVPISQIKENITGNIKIADAKAKSYPIFFAKAYIEELQSYVTYADNVEDVTTDSTFNIDAYKSGIEIIKTDEETGKELSGVTFNVKYSDTNQNIGDFTTDASGKIVITGLRQGKITITEKSTKEEYELDSTPIEVELEYEQIKQIDINNLRKKGNLKIIKIDKDNNEI
ncbi:MAG: SpaA isopeptide-forming pilin-related protein, partial [Clostridia bacterium]